MAVSSLFSAGFGKLTEKFQLRHIKLSVLQLNPINWYYLSFIVIELSYFLTTTILS